MKWEGFSIPPTKHFSFKSSLERWCIRSDSLPPRCSKKKTAFTAYNWDLLKPWKIQSPQIYLGVTATFNTNRLLFLPVRRGSERTVVGLRSGAAEIAISCHNTAERFPLLCKTYTYIRPVKTVHRRNPNWPHVEVFGWYSSFVFDTSRIRATVWKQIILVHFSWLSLLRPV